MLGPIRYLPLAFLLTLLAWDGDARATAGSDSDSRPSVGIYYFPGWHKGARGLPYPDPWLPIQKFPEREPMLGWYDDADVGVVKQQLTWMADYGIDYVVFDWYWDAYGVFANHAIDAYKKVHLAGKPRFALMWANHDAEPASRQSFIRMVRYWIENYLSQDDYLKVGGMPVVFLFKASNIEDRAKIAGESMDELMSIAQSIARDAALPGIFFVGGAAGGTGLPLPSKKQGISAYSAYNYHSGPGGMINDERRSSRNYQELTSAYHEQWRWFMSNADIPYIVPATVGWNRRPWGGSEDPLHDNSGSTPAEFGEHLDSATSFLLNNPAKAAPSILVCCWNEYGEGSVVEPTRKWSMQYLEQIKSVSPGFQPLEFPIASPIPDEKRKDSRHLK